MPSGAARFCFVLAALVAAPATAAIDVVFGIGAAHTLDADIELTDPPSTSLDLEGVPFTDESFEDPPYYTLRIAYWLERHPRWGFGLELTHAKAIARGDDRVEVRGVRDGVPVLGEEPVGATFSDLQLSHGHNLALVDGLYRWRAPEHGVGSYVGLGLGAAVPHVEVTTARSSTSEYQIAGPAAQGLLGAEFPLGRRWSLMAEYRLSWARIDADLDGGGTLEVRPLTHQLAAGAVLEIH